MSRRDTIIISVLINAGLLSILFATAWSGDDEDSATSAELPPVVQEKVVIPEPVVVAEIPPPPKPQPLIASPPMPEPVAALEAIAEDPESLEVTVKRGDFLGKIASANGVTVEELVKLNNLRSTQLQIGQKIRVPVGAAVQKPTRSGSAEVAQDTEKFHTVQRGDSPWSISNRYNIELVDILRLNGLDEESARNLRAGQRIRIRA
jgi:LysM repeat protein